MAQVSSALPDALRARIDGEVRFDAGSRAVYATAASNYRHVPIGVVLPRTIEDAVEAIAVCREFDVPVLSRGGGTSLAGQTSNTAVVIDWSKYCNRIVSLDVDQRVAVVEPGVVLDELNDRLAPHGLQVGPRPSTHASCTIGGMIGNNSCGASAQKYGKMADSVRGLDVLTYRGLRMWVGADGEDAHDATGAGEDEKASLLRSLNALRDTYLAEIRLRYPNIPRLVSGYNLDALLPENGFDIARALVGSEGTLATVLQAEIALVPVPETSVLVVLGFPSVIAAADAVPSVAKHQPAKLEGIDQRLVELEHSKHLAEEAIDQLPEGNGWLMVEFAGSDKSDVERRSADLISDLRANSVSFDATIYQKPERIQALWQAREAGLGATAYPPDGPATHEGWEDAAVPPEMLGNYLRDFQQLLESFGYGSASLYGHFGHGCVHTRIPFDLRSSPGIAKYRRFVEAAAELVAGYGGSLSGEHGDGQARAELLPVQFGTRIVQAFREMKALFDPDNKMNPGKVVDPEPLDSHLRLGADYRPFEPTTHFAFAANGHRFSEAANRCVGIGNCRGHSGGVMCPSYRVTREEEHSTRGRARLLFEMLQGDVITTGWRSREVRDALDLCLACKGCLSDCPVDVDMATYKAEFMSHYYARRLRPLAHYSMGWLPAIATAARRVPNAVNVATHAPGLGSVLKAIGGVDRRRELPLFADEDLRAWMSDRVPKDAANGEVVLWPDTFTTSFEPAIGKAAVEVLEDAGWSVVAPPDAACCGLTWISTGQLGIAKAALRRTLRVLRPHLRAGTPIVVLEPSCAAVFRADLVDLLHGDEDAERLAAQTYTLAELLSERASTWTPDTRLERSAVAQPHCHQYAVLGYDSDADLMRRCGMNVDVLDAGCCGLAGNFGYEQGHYEVSVACAEHELMPAIRGHASDGDLVLADGFSCRRQIEHTEPSVRPMHIAEILAAAVRGELPGEPERQPAPSAAARWLATGIAAASVPLAIASFRRLIAGR